MPPRPPSLGPSWPLPRPPQEALRESIRALLQHDVRPELRADTGVERCLRRSFPVHDFNDMFRLEVASYEVHEAPHGAGACRGRRLTHARPVLVTLRLCGLAEAGPGGGPREVLWATEETVPLCDMPVPTRDGTFVVRGRERVLVSQLRRAPGVFLSHDGGGRLLSGKRVYALSVMPARGQGLRLSIGGKGTMTALLRRKKVPAHVLLQALCGAEAMRGLERFEVMRRSRALLPMESDEAACFELVRVLFGDAAPAAPDVASQLARSVLAPRRVELGASGRASLDARIGPRAGATPWLEAADLVPLAAMLLDAHERGAEGDDEADLRHAVVRSPGLLLEDALSIGLERAVRSIKEMLSICTIADGDMPSAYARFGPVDAVLERFLLRSPLSRPADRRGAISLAAQLREVSGRSAFEGEVQPGLRLQRAHPSHVGALCPVDVSGDRGSSLALAAAVDDEGRLERRDAGLDGVLGLVGGLVPLLEHDRPEAARRAAWALKRARSLAWADAPLVSTGLEERLLGRGARYGQSVLVALCPGLGQNVGSGAIVAERVVASGAFTSVERRRLSTLVVGRAPGKEACTSEQVRLSARERRSLDEDGVAMVGARPAAGEVLVGKVRLAEGDEPVVDRSLRAPHGASWVVSGASTHTRAEAQLSKRVSQVVDVELSALCRLEAGDVIASRHGDVCVVQAIVPDADMPVMPDGTPVDVVLRPDAVIARGSLGLIAEIELGAVGEAVRARGFATVTGEGQGELAARLASSPASVALRDGATGLAFEGPALVGRAYLVKIARAEEAFEARGDEGPFEGQLIGEDEIAALSAHGAAYTLAELLSGRRGDEAPREVAPAGLHDLARELAALGLSVEAERAPLTRRGRRAIDGPMGEIAESLEITARGAAVRISLRVKPRASRTEVTGVREGALELAVAAPPVDGEANEAVIKAVAGLLEVPRREVSIVAGETGRQKVVEVSGVTVEAARQLLGARLAKVRAR